jgi:hypothetical protein
MIITDIFWQNWKQNNYPFKMLIKNCLMILVFLNFVKFQDFLPLKQIKSLVAKNLNYLLKTDESNLIITSTMIWSSSTMERMETTIRARYIGKWKIRRVFDLNNVSIISLPIVHFRIQLFILIQESLVWANQIHDKVWANINCNLFDYYSRIIIKKHFCIQSFKHLFNFIFHKHIFSFNTDFFLPNIERIISDIREAERLLIFIPSPIIVINQKINKITSI